MADLRVIEGGGEGPEKQWAKDEFAWAIRDLTANLLRIVRGAGKPYEVLRQTKSVIESAVRFQELHGYWPTELITNELKLEGEDERWHRRLEAGSIDRASIDRWWKDGTFEKMFAEYEIQRGALQMIASGLLGQATQKCAGETELHKGLQAYEEVRARRRAEAAAMARIAKSPPRAPAKRKSKRSLKMGTSEKPVPTKPDESR